MPPNAASTAATTSSNPVANPPPTTTTTNTDHSPSSSDAKYTASLHKIKASLQNLDYLYTHSLSTRYQLHLPHDPYNIESDHLITTVVTHLAALSGLAKLTSLIRQYDANPTSAAQLNLDMFQVIGSTSPAMHRVLATYVAEFLRQLIGHIQDPHAKEWVDLRVKEGLWEMFRGVEGYCRDLDRRMEKYHEVVLKNVPPVERTLMTELGCDGDMVREWLGLPMLDEKGKTEGDGKGGGSQRNEKGVVEQVEGQEALQQQWQQGMQFGGVEGGLAANGRN